MQVTGSMEIGRPAGEVWAYVADYGNDSSWRAGVLHMRPSTPGPAQVGVTTHEALRLLGLTFVTDAAIYQVEPGRRLEWRARDRLKQLQGSRLVEPTGKGATRFTETMELRLLGPMRLFVPLIGWLLRRQTRADLRRLKQLLEARSSDLPGQGTTP
jgi:uncharacterized membrane protein